MDGQYRIQDGIIDIGADESDGCGWCYPTLAVNPEIGTPGQEVTVTAVITRGDGQPVPLGTPVCFTATGGTITEINGSPPPPSGCGETDVDEKVTVRVTRDTPGYVTVTAEVGNPCGGPTTESIYAWFYDPNAPPDIFFCLDCTGSMWGVGDDHGAQASVNAFLSEMSNTYGIQFRVGGIKFNQGNDILDWFDKDDGGKLLPTVFTSLAAFQSLATATAWIDNGYSPFGGDFPELQLDALHYANLDMNAYAVSSHRYIVLITDDTYHDGSGGSLVSKNQVIQELTATTGCPVYISLWNDAYHNDYTQLIVNGGEFDPSNTSGTDQGGNWRYPLANLRARILADLGN